jgi:hypothetical protein
VEVFIATNCNAIATHTGCRARRRRRSRAWDRLVVLEQGRIVEQGTHDELLRLDGHDAVLWKHQSGGSLANQAAAKDCGGMCASTRRCSSPRRASTMSRAGPEPGR